MLVVIGVSHKTAPIEIREKLSFSPEGIHQALSDLILYTPLNEAVLLSTCNRTEIYGGVNTQGVDPKDIVQWWKQYQPGHHALLSENTYYQLSGERVVTHIMRLACGLESLALGETQILGQLKQAYRHSQTLGLVGGVLSQTFEASFSAAKKIRTQTEISQHPTSIAYLSVLLAKRIFTDLTQTRVLLVGAGENVQHLLSLLKSHGLNRITLTNRTYEKAQALSLHYQVECCPLEHLTEGLAQADLVITSTGSPDPLIDLKRIKRAFVGHKHRPLLMIDLGVPRDIDPDVQNHEDVYLYGIDDLKSIADENQASREKAACEAERLVAYEACALIAKLHARGQVQPIKDLRERAEGYKQKALDAAKAELKKGTPPEEIIEQLAFTLTNQLIHEPTLRMKNALISQDQKLIELYQHMFCKE